MKEAAASGRLYLIDAHAYLHRAYHALPALKNGAGEPVGALYGFCRMLLGLLKREKPEFLAVCFDSSAPTFRHRAYAAYKATRKETDGDLKSQLALARPLAEALGLACAELPGYEADDLMATLARAAKGLEVVLVTMDKDALQLVGDRIKVLHEGKGELLDAGKVRKRYGVGPEQMADFLALTGDSSDNVPGVAGVGPVGAAKLLARYRNIESLLRAARAGDAGLPAKLARTLAGSEEKLRMSRGLVALEEAAPVPLGPKDCRVRPPDAERLLPLLERLEFHSIARELAPGIAGGESGRARNDSAPPTENSSPRRGGEFPTPSPGGRASVPSEGDLGAHHARGGEPPVSLPAGEWLKAAAAARRVSVAFRPGLRLELLGTGFGLALGLPDGRTCWVESRELDSGLPAWARLFGPGVEKVGHDLKPALLALRRAGLAFSGPRFDTRLAAWCLDPSRGGYEFRDLAAEPEEPADERGRALREAAGVWALAERQKAALEAGGLLRLYEELELPLIEALAGMEAEGIGLDAAWLKDLGGELDGRIRALKIGLDRMAGGELNPNSPKQLARLLFEELKLPVIHKTPKGGASTDEETLRALTAHHPLPAKLIEYRELAKLRSTYVEGLLERLDPSTLRVHTRFNQTGTATGRLSSLDPNLQNIPIRTPLGAEIRRAFVPRPSAVLLSADYSQIDLRALAHLSGDPALTGAFARGEDVHLRTATEIFGVGPEGVDAEMRRRAKAVNFGIVYGQTAHGLGLELGIPIGQAKAHIERYFERYAGVARWSRETLDKARREGSVRTLLGRVRPLPDISARNTAVRQFNERVALNTPIQGTSADIIKKAMVDIHREMASGRWKAVLLLQVHDELLFEVPEGELRAFAAWVRGRMEAAVALDVPLVVDLKSGPNWRDLRALEVPR